MKADICLILEGTYPYVAGGVSNWIQTLVTSLNDFTFSIVHLSSTGDIIKSPKYEIPENIVEFKEIFVHDFNDDTSKTVGKKQDGWDAVRRLYEDLGRDDLSNLKYFYDAVIDKKTRLLNIHDLMFSKKSWEIALELYRNIAPDVSFVDFFWTMRLIHIPIFNLFNADIPDASVYHTVCTGYAGLLSVIAKRQKQAPLLLTEHGIYTHERRIDISRAKWIYTDEQNTTRAVRSLGFLKDIWIRTFELLGELTYFHADKIATLFEGNRRMQIEDGADSSKISIISNGVVLPKNDNIRALNNGKPKAVGFVGRVVSVKDIKTFIRAMKIVKEKIPDIKVYIIGFDEEDPEYARECRVLVQMLGMQKNVIFTGSVNVEDYYPILDVVVLTSISEGQPLSVLEAMSHGIPIVSTNVGASVDIILGKNAEDEALGAAGVVTNVGAPSETATAVINILENEQTYKKMSQVGKDRIKKYYDINDMVKDYRQIYESLLKESLSGTKTAQT